VCLFSFCSLQPANIFLDAEGNIKLGDFGLATFRAEASNGLGTSASSGNLLMRTASATDVAAMIAEGTHGGGGDISMSRDSSNLSLSDLMKNVAQMHETYNSDMMLSNTLTGGIGTAMYRAPEQEYQYGPASSAGGGRGYDDKADMFSLGVILFEMCHAPFTTGMERLLTMRQLREKAELPAGFGVAYSTEDLATIVRWLVQQQPSQRPSAKQLLASPLLPARVDTDSRYLREITEALWKPNCTAAAGIISVLFNNSIEQQQQQLLVRGGGNPYSSSLGIADPSSSSNAALNNRASVYLSGGQDGVSAVSYDLEVLQQSLELLQPRSIPRRGLLTAAQLLGSSSNSSSSSSSSSATSASSSTLSGGRTLKQMALLREERSVVSLQYNAAIKRQLRQTFETHGAVHYCPGLLQLRSNPGLAKMMQTADSAVMPRQVDAAASVSFSATSSGGAGAGAGAGAGDPTASAAPVAAVPAAAAIAQVMLLCIRVFLYITYV
jgi:serine/threonine protein kinase